MKLKNYFIKITLPTLILFLSIGISFAQTSKFPTPRERTLLNELKLLTWKVPGDEKITVKLRVHSGSAFDPQDKEGLMVLLGNILFPSEAAKQTFEEDLGGKLEIINTYDFIQINATANKDELLTVLETLSNSILNPLIDKENTAIVKNAQIEKIKELENNPAYLADQAVKKRLFGDFPYGRPVDGTLNSLEKIDFADIVFARQKFLTADNATLIVFGDIDQDFVYKAVRRFFGNWKKANEKVPAYFRLPDKPDGSISIQKSPVENTSELRFAFRGIARNDKDFYASEILKNVFENRLQKNDINKLQVKNSVHFLPGYVIVSSKDWNLGNIKRSGDSISLPVNMDSMVQDALKEPVSNAEFEKAKSYRVPSNLDEYTDWWLDADTFRLSAVKNEIQKSQSVTLADVNRVADFWRKEPVTGVLLFKEKETETGNTPQTPDQK